MRKIALLLIVTFAAAACAKHDPILPGERTAIFDAGDIKVLDMEIENVSADAYVPNTDNCPYTQDSANVIWRGDKKIFSGFPTSNSVKNTQKPVCSGKYVYAGLTTGELVKINSATREIEWVADIYRPTNITGGASVLDIVAPIIVYNDSVYVGGLGDAFCRVNAANGAKKWCVNIGVAEPFIVTDAALFVVGTDKNLYAVRNSDGAIYWRRELATTAAPQYENKTISVGREKFNAKNGKKIK